MSFIYIVALFLVLKTTSDCRSYPLNEFAQIERDLSNEFFPNDDLFKIRKFDQNNEDFMSNEEPEMMDLAATHIFHPLFKVRKPRNKTSDRIDQSKRIFYISK